MNEGKNFVDNHFMSFTVDYFVFIANFRLK